MIDAVWEAVRFLGEQMEPILGLGRDVQDVGSVQMVLRAILVYALAVLLVRIGSKRFLSQATAFDVIVAIMLGSILSRAINGSAPFLPTMLAGAAVVGAHWVFAVVAARTSSFGSMIKGEPRLLIKDGEVQEDEMRRAKITANDLMQALRLQVGIEDPSRISRAYLERNGRISMIPYEDKH